MLKTGVRVAAAFASLLVVLLPTSALFVGAFPYVEDTAIISLWLLVVVLPALLWVLFHDYSLERLTAFGVAVWALVFVLQIPIELLQGLLASVGLLPHSSVLWAGPSLAAVYYFAYFAVYRGGYERAKRWVTS